MIPDIRIAVLGGVDSSKSSIIGTLVTGELDDGRGKNRAVVMNYQHEIESGMTSSVGYQLLGFKENGEIVKLDQNDLKSKKASWPKIMKQAAKTITFLDLAGHTHYIGTTIYGISSNRPDYCLILIEAKGIKGTTKEHLILCLTFGIPFIVLITKTDLYKNTVTETINNVTKMVASAKKIAWVLKDESELMNFNKNPNIQVPIIPVSCVSGEGLEILKKFLFKLPNRVPINDSITPFESSILETFNVHGIGTVLHLFIVKGVIKTGDIVHIGPTETGEYLKTKIRSLQYKRVPIESCTAGKHVCAAITGIDRKNIKTGMYMIHNNVIDKPIVKTFKAEIKVITGHSTSIRVGYCPILNVDNIKMAVRIKDIFDKNNQCIQAIRSGDSAYVIMELMYRPVFLRLNDTFIFREGFTRGKGNIIEIIKE